MSNTNSVVAVFQSHELAEEAIRELQNVGFDMKTLSVVGKDYHTEKHVVGYYTTGERIIVGSAFFWVPGIGPQLVAGPLVATIVGGLEAPS